MQGLRSRFPWWQWSYAVDYLILVLVETFALMLPAVVGPHHRFVPDGDTTVQFPLKESIVPGWAAVVLALGAPMLIFCLYQIRCRSLHDLHHATLTLLQAFCFTNVVTNIFKLYCGRPRPDWAANHLITSDAWMYVQCLSVHVFSSSYQVAAYISFYFHFLLSSIALTLAAGRSQVVTLASPRLAL